MSLEVRGWHAKIKMGGWLGGASWIFVAIFWVLFCWWVRGEQKSRDQNRISFVSYRPFLEYNSRTNWRCFPVCVCVLFLFSWIVEVFNHKKAVDWGLVCGRLIGIGREKRKFGRPFLCSRVARAILGRLGEAKNKGGHFDRFISLLYSYVSFFVSLGS